MRVLIPSFFIVLAVCAGCSSREVRPVAGVDYTHRSERQQLKAQPVPIPSVTPYDGNQHLQAVFVSGFRKGWDVAIEYWLGNAITIPEAYQQSAKRGKTAATQASRLSTNVLAAFPQPSDYWGSVELALARCTKVTLGDGNWWEGAYYLLGRLTNAVKFEAGGVPSMTTASPARPT